MKLKAKSNSRFVCGALCVIFSVFNPLLPVAIGQQANKPITKGDLIRSFEPGRREKIGAASYIELITRNGVDFSLTPEDEKRIRLAGKYLGRKGVEDLITAIRNNYRPNMSEASSQPASGEPTEAEMKEALLRSTENWGGQQNADGCVRFDNPVAGTCVRITKFQSLGCTPSSQGAGYFCTYRIGTSLSLHSNEKTPDATTHVGIFDQLLEKAGARRINGTTTKRFVRSKEGWVVTDE